MRVAVVGNLTLDTIGKVASLPTVNDFAYVEELGLFYGGWAGNIAIILQHLGIETSLFGVVGADFAESGYASRLAHLGVETGTITRLPNAKCAHFTIFRDHNENSYAFFEPNVEAEHYDQVLTKEVDLSRFDLICLAKFGSERATESYLESVLSNNHCVLATAIGGDIRSKGTTRLLHQVLATAKYIFINQIDVEILMSLLGLDHIQAVFSFPTRKVEAVIITEGGAGSAVYTIDSQEPIRIPAVAPVRLVSTLGAGDAYTAAFLYGTTKQWNLQKCGEFAATLSSFVLEGEGAQSRLPTNEELQERLAEAFHDDIS